jgi:hypothetical protein
VDLHARRLVLLVDYTLDACGKPPEQPDAHAAGLSRCRRSLHRALRAGLRTVFSGGACLGVGFEQFDADNVAASGLLDVDDSSLALCDAQVFRDWENEKSRWEFPDVPYDCLCAPVSHCSRPALPAAPLVPAWLPALLPLCSRLLAVLAWERMVLAQGPSLAALHHPVHALHARTHADAGGASRCRCPATSPALLHACLAPLPPAKRLEARAVVQMAAQAAGVGTCRMHDASASSAAPAGGFCACELSPESYARAVTALLQMPEDDEDEDDEDEDEAEAGAEAEGCGDDEAGASDSFDDLADELTVAEAASDAAAEPATEAAADEGRVRESSLAGAAIGSEPVPRAATGSDADPAHSATVSPPPQAGGADACGADACGADACGADACGADACGASTAPRALPAASGTGSPTGTPDESSPAPADASVAAAPPLRPAYSAADCVFCCPLLGLVQDRVCRVLGVVAAIAVPHETADVDFFAFSDDEESEQVFVELEPPAEKARRPKKPQLLVTELCSLTQSAPAPDEHIEDEHTG